MAQQTKIKILSLAIFGLASCYPTTVNDRPLPTNNTFVNHQRERCDELRPSIESMRQHCESYTNSVNSDPNHTINHRYESICWTVRNFDEHCNDELVQ